MKIETKKELQYIMQFHNIPYVEIVNEGRNLGKVTKEMKYEKGFLRSYKDEYVYLAFEDACKQVSKDYDEIVTWKEISKKVFTTRMLSGEWNKEKIPVTGYMWMSDAEKCHIRMSKDDEGNLLLQGRINDLKNFISYANDHMRYCRSCYSFESDEVNHYIDLFNRYGLKNADDDSYEWWRVGIVD